MTKVRIDTPGATVEIESDEPLSVVSRKALKLFKAAGGWPQDGHGPATGFSAMERRWSPESNGSAMRVPPGPVGFGRAEDKAETERIEAWKRDAGQHAYDEGVR